MMGWALMVLLAASAGAVPVDADAPGGPVRLDALKDRVWHDDAPPRDGSHRMTCVMEYLGSRGEVTKTLVLEHKRTFRGGRMHEELLSAREDDRDVTDRERRKQEESAADRRGSPLRWSVDESLAPPLPFIYDADAYTVIGVSSTGVFQYRPSGRTPGRAATGSVSLDPSDGLPVRHEFVPVPLPRMIRQLVTVVRYGRIAGVAVPVATETTGEGGLLFLKRRFRVTMTYRDWVL
jgi:hypothetical protein